MVEESGLQGEFFRMYELEHPKMLKRSIHRKKEVDYFLNIDLEIVNG